MYEKDEKESSFLIHCSYKEALALIKDSEAEINWLVTLFPDEKSQVIVLGHNDFNSGNVIYDAKTEKVTFIDFEMAKLNYQGWDIARHFTQFGGNYGNGDAVYKVSK